MLNNELNLCEERIYSKIFMEYADTLYNYIYYKSGNKALAQDLTQESFLMLWINCKDVGINTAKGYVFKTANNKMINAFNHEKVKLKFKNKYIENDHAKDPSFILEEKEFGIQLENAISALPEKQRVAFLLSRIDKKTYKEIAEILGISKQAVEKRIYNALDILRKISNKIK